VVLVIDKSADDVDSRQTDNSQRSERTERRRTEEVFFFTVFLLVLIASSSSSGVIGSVLFGFCDSTCGGLYDSTIPNSVTINN